MEIQVGDRFIDQGEEWEVLTHPAAMHGGKSLRASVQPFHRPRLGLRGKGRWLAQHRLRGRRRRPPRQPQRRRSRAPVPRARGGGGQALGSLDGEVAIFDQQLSSRFD
jgi:hypothetical protein